jgi:GNAT superfamily N-acetyltransferase
VSPGLGIVFRRGRVEDGPALVGLVEELGYPARAEEVSARLARLLVERDQELFVAEEGAEIVGWVHVQEFLSLASDPAALVTGLVVAPHARRRGIGRGLMDRAEQWARARGLASLRLRSRTARSEAHAFYRRLGFEAAKQQVQFRKELGRGLAGRD